MTTSRIGLVGSGDRAAWHLATLRAAGAEVVGIVDDDKASANELAEHFGIVAFPTLALLHEAGTTAIHVVASASSRGEATLQALELGNDVLVEPPLAMTKAEAERLAETAERIGRRVWVGTSLLFHPAFVDALKAIREGAIGTVISADFDCGFAYPPFKGGTLPPYYRDPSGPFRDVGAYGLHVLRALLGPIQRVHASWTNRGSVPYPCHDTWLTEVVCEGGAGHLTVLPSQDPLTARVTVRGMIGEVRLTLPVPFGPMPPPRPVPPAVAKAAHVLIDRLPFPGAVVDPLRRALPTSSRDDPGLAAMLRAFHDPARSASPIALDEALEVSLKVLEVGDAAADEIATHTMSLEAGETKPAVLVTGAGGGLGSATVRALLDRGERVRIFVRRRPKALEADVEVALGDLGDRDAVGRAVRGVRKVVHAGAAMHGDWSEHQRGTILGTQNVCEACAEHEVDKLVYISSMSVIQMAGEAPGANTDESTPYEADATSRGFYTQAKLEAERQVLSWCSDQRTQCVVLRPGMIFGATMPLKSGAIASPFGGPLLVLGDGRLRLPLVYLDDVIDAILAALERDVDNGAVIQLVDPETFTQNDVLARLHASQTVLRTPRSLVFAAGKLSEVALAVVNKRSPVAAYRLQSGLADRRYESTRAQRLLGWKPRVGVSEGLRRLVDRA